MLLWGIAFELTFAAAIAYVPFLQSMFRTASMNADTILLLIPFPFVVWGVDELRHWGPQVRVPLFVRGST
jgi:hypothetical protein